MRSRFALPARVLLLLGLAQAAAVAGQPPPVVTPLVHVEVTYGERAGASAFKDRLAGQLTDQLARSNCVRLARPDAPPEVPDFKLEIAIRDLQEELEFDRTLAERASGDPDGRGHTTARIETAIDARLAAGETTVRSKAFRSTAAHTAVQFEDPREEALRDLLEGLVRRLGSWTCKGTARTRR